MASTIADTSFQPPYMAWTTFENILDHLRAVGIPGRLDRSVLRSRSGTDQAQFLRAAQQFGLIDESDAPTARLRTLVADSERRPEILREILRERYADVVALGTDATAQQLTDAFRKFGIEGDTIRKAVAFYLNAARQAEIPLSPHFGGTRPGAGGRKTTRRKPSGGKVNSEAPPPVQTPLTPKRPPLVSAMIDKLPSTDDGWSVDEAKQWLSLVAPALAYDYKLDLAAITGQTP